MAWCHPHSPRMTPGTYYVWVSGSCDYGHEDRCSGGAYIMLRDGEVIETHTYCEKHTTEFRMILSAMIHAMKVIPEGSDIVFLTNVSYIQMNFDRKPNEKSANPDLILKCIRLKEKHRSIEVKLVPFHKYRYLTEANTLAHSAMMALRNQAQGI